VLVIALFYTEQIRWLALAVAGVLLLLLFAAIQARIRRLGVLLPLIVGVWLAVFASGVHATVAGILVAMVVPVRARIEPGRFLAVARERLARLEGAELSQHSMIDDPEQLDAIEGLHHAAGEMVPPGLALEHWLHPVQVWFILPLFALANAGVALGGGTGAALANPISLGIVAGLVLGKPVGIMLFSWLTVRSGRGALPAGVTWGQLAGAGCLAGIGFTMSLFVAELAFADPGLIAAAKIGILAASLTAAVCGATVLTRSLARSA